MARAKMGRPKKGEIEPPATSDAANKAEAVRRYEAEHPDEKPAKISAALKEQGLDVSPSYISNIRAQDRRKGGGKSGKGKGRSDTEAQLKAAADFVESCGGFDEAISLLKSLQRIRNL